MKEIKDILTNDILTVKDLCLWYGQTQALKNITMDIPERRSPR